jgi:release factor glutamine methyltransferase
MPVELDDSEWKAVVARLRAGGCVFAEAESDLLLEGAGNRGELDAMIARRVAGTPVELVLGWADFGRVRVAVEPGVFVPRLRTRFLAHLASEFLTSGDVIVDLCCGAGPIGAYLLEVMREPGDDTIELHAADVDEVAVRCARKNLATAIETGHASVYQGDLDAPLPARLAGQISILTANVPYVPSAEIPLLPSEARDYEPLTALDGGADGLDLLRRVAQAAPRWLRPGGRLLIEISDRQQEAAIAAFRAAGLDPSLHESEEYDSTVLVGRARANPQARS